MDIINISNEIDRKKLIQNAFLRKITKAMISFNALMHFILKGREKDMIKFFLGFKLLYTDLLLRDIVNRVSCFGLCILC